MKKSKDPSMEQTAAELMTTQGIGSNLVFSEKDIITLKELAKKVRHYAE